MVADRPTAVWRWVLLLGVLPGCYASNVVAVADRAKVERALPTEWRPAAAVDLPGLHASVAITGDAAVALRRVWYWFDAGGRYTGAALVEADNGLEFQTSSGTWSLGDGGLRLDDADAVPIDASGSMLRIRNGLSEVVLDREPWR